MNARLSSIWDSRSVRTLVFVAGLVAFATTLSSCCGILELGQC